MKRCLGPGLLSLGAAVLLSSGVTKPALGEAVSVSIGPSNLFALPGLAARFDVALSGRVLALGEVHGEALSNAARFGLRVGGDYFPLSEEQEGLYLGARLGGWRLMEPTVNTMAIQGGVMAGWRRVGEGGWVLQGGAGLQPRIVLTGDQSWHNPLSPALEFRIGRRLK